MHDGRGAAGADHHARSCTPNATRAAPAIPPSGHVRTIARSDRPHMSIGPNKRVMRSPSQYAASGQWQGDGTRQDDGKHKARRRRPPGPSVSSPQRPPRPPRRLAFDLTSGNGFQRQLYSEGENSCAAVNNIVPKAYTAWSIWSSMPPSIADTRPALLSQIALLPTKAAHRHGPFLRVQNWGTLETAYHKDKPM